jgi:hypothetical protein
MPFKDPKRKKECDRQYLIDHRDKIYESHKQWRTLNPNKVKEYSQAYVAKWPTMRKTTSNKYARSMRHKWEAWFHKNKLDECTWCGYNLCFASIDFHHTGDKQFGISYFITSHPVTEAHCLTLSNCHRMLHFDLGREGRVDS